MNLELVNKKNQMDGLDLLTYHIGKGELNAVFFDPQYREVLNHLHYGNEGKRQKARCMLPQMDEQTISCFIKEIEIDLAKSGYLFFWTDKYNLCEGKAREQILSATNKLHIVDLITWDKCKMGMGYRTRRQAEYLLVVQKEPIKAKSTWRDHTIRDIWAEEIVESERKHAHEKPEFLERHLIEAVTNEGDFVCDPAAGSYSVFRACRATDRSFIGADIITK